MLRKHFLNSYRVLDRVALRHPRIVQPLGHTLGESWLPVSSPQDSVNHELVPAYPILSVLWLSRVEVDHNLTVVLNRNPEATFKHLR